MALKNFYADQTQIDRLTPKGADASEKAINAAKRIMMLDGMVLVRDACRDSTSDLLAFTAFFARIIDAEMK